MRTYELCDLWDPRSLTDLDAIGLGLGFWLVTLFFFVAVQAVLG